jgi:hypothetical protein
MNINFAEPPDHGPWQDLHHLMTTFKDKHSKYVRRCSPGSAVSVWNCYNSTDKESILKHLNSTPEGRQLGRNETSMERLSDSEVYELLQRELGLTSEIAVENALSAITLTGSILERTTWVNFHTAWCQVLKRAACAGTLQPRRMVDLFRAAIPDPFVSQWLKARKFSTWEDAYDAAITALSDSQWLVEYSKHLLQQMQKQSAQPQRQQQHQHQQPSQDKQPPQQKPAQPSQPPASTPATAPPSDKAAAQQPKHKKPFVPLEYKNRRNQVNHNPNMKQDLNLNPENTPCTRCEEVHRYPSELCTAPVRSSKKGQPALTPEEHNMRIRARWDAGFFFAKPLASYASPSPQDAAAQASKAASTFNS